MGTSTALLGIDLGTSGVKAGIFDPSGALLGMGREAYLVDRPRPGWAQADVEAWWQATARAVRAALEEARVERSAVAGVGLGVLYPAVTLLDAALRPLCPAILYCDQRATAQAAAIRAALPAIEDLAGNVPAPGNCAAASLLWLRDEMPGAWRAARWAAWAGTALLARLTGAVAADPSMASLSGLARIAAPDRWDAGLCSALGIETGLLPPILASHAVAGRVTDAAAAATGLAPGTAVVCGCGDTPASVFGTGVIDPGDIVCTTGSTDCVVVALERPTPDRRWVNTTHAVAGRWLATGTITSSGSSLEWFCREVLGRKDPGARHALCELAGQSPPGAGGVVFLPYLQGERTPHWDPLARGTFFGLSTATRRADLARAVLEGVAFALRSVFESLDGVGAAAPSSIRLAGGGAASPAWNRIKADVLGMRVLSSSFSETGCLGAALLAGVGTGAYRDFAQAADVARVVGDLTTVEPDPSVRPVYEELYGVFSDLYPATREMAHRLSRMQSA